MPKRATALPLMLAPRPAAAPAARWLFEALRSEILEGRLRPGARLPASRDLARQYRLSRGTVVERVRAAARRGLRRGTRRLGHARQRRAARRSAARAAPRPTGPPRHAPRAGALSSLRAAGDAVPRLRAPLAARLPRQPAGARPLPHHAVGQGGRASPAARHAGAPAGHGGPWLPAAAGGGGGLPAHLARRALRAGPGGHRLRRAGGAGPRGAPGRSTAATGWPSRIRATAAPPTCSRRTARPSFPFRWTPKASRWTPRGGAGRGWPTSRPRTSSRSASA